jgi:CelD/BcsL family acetyltransferase involved in cellulose biosynthesis
MNTLTAPSLHARVLSSFDDSSLSPNEWNDLLERSHTNAINLTWQWQRNWWKSFGRGRLMLVILEDADRPVCIAPLFVDDGMIFNVCPEDHLDLIGEVSRDSVEAIITCALENVPGFQGLRVYFVPQSSPTSHFLQQAATHFGFTCIQESSFPSPRLEISAQPDAAAACTRKKSLLRHENYFRREGRLTIQHATTAEEILPQLDEFFDQHIARRAATPNPSLFVEQRQRDYYRSITENIGPTGWLRFTRIEWNSRPIAFHFGASYAGRYLFGIPSFAIEFERHSPGEVLLRQLILAAIEEGAAVFDFGIGDEAYKYRFATSQVQLVTWGIYPKSSRYLPRPQP